MGAWTVPGDKIDELEAKGVTTIITEQPVPHEREQMRSKALAKREKKLARRAMAAGE